MSLFAIADPHLSFNTSKPMDVFAGWADYTARLEKNWRELVGPEDTVVIAGDISWGMDLREAAADFAFLDRLPGRKILMKGNHDYWWTTRKKMDAFLLSLIHICWSSRCCLIPRNGEISWSWDGTHRNLWSNG